VPPAGAGRQPGRARLLAPDPRRAGRPRAGAEPQSRRRPAMPARGSRPGAPKLRGARPHCRARRFLQRRRRAPRDLPSRHFPRRRSARGRARCRRTAGDPAALSPCYRRSPDRQCRRLRRGRRRLADARSGGHAREPGQAPRRAHRRSHAARRGSKRRAQVRRAGRRGPPRRSRRGAGRSEEAGGGMRALPLEIGLLHFIGIGGIGMSGIAEILHNLGYQVQGSDLADNYNVKRLRDAGVHVAIGHRPENLGEAAVVVVSSAVKADNPELMAARTRQIPIVRRAEMLGELMRLKWSVAVGGTHGKTTTTSLVAALLDAAGFDPTVINGGIINNYGTNARMGAGDWMVVEADESDGTFTKLPATIAVVTNMDAEHLDFYGSVEALNHA